MKDKSNVKRRAGVSIPTMRLPRRVPDPKNFEALRNLIRVAKMFREAKVIRRRPAFSALRLRLPQRTPDVRGLAILGELERTVAFLRSGLSPKDRKRTSWA